MPEQHILPTRPNEHLNNLVIFLSLLFSMNYEFVSSAFYQFQDVYYLFHEICESCSQGFFCPEEKVHASTCSMIYVLAQLSITSSPKFLMSRKKLPVLLQTVGITARSCVVLRVRVIGLTQVSAESAAQGR